MLLLRDAMLTADQFFVCCLSVDYNAQLVSFVSHFLLNADQMNVIETKVIQLQMLT